MSKNPNICEINIPISNYEEYNYSQNISVPKLSAKQSWELIGNSMNLKNQKLSTWNKLRTYSLEQQLASTSLPSMLYENGGLKGSFRRAVWPFLLIGQFFGVMPLVGVRNRLLSDLKFKWKSLRTFYSLALAVLLFGYVLILFWTLLNSVAGLELIGIILYYSTNAMEFASFLYLAMKWPKLMQQWQITESNLNEFCTRRFKKSYIAKVRFVSLSFLFLALVEHSIADYSWLDFVATCHKEQDSMTALVQHNVPHIIDSYERLPFAYAIFINFINVSSTFVWNFLDIFIMIVSIGLSTHFRLLNNEIRNATFESLSHEFWISMRIQYSKLCDLVTIVDGTISHLILFSFFNNLFFICRQLFESLRPRHQTFYRILYFWFSLSLVILRTFVVSLCGARINDESKEPAIILHSVPTTSWCTETKRFLDEVVHNTVALSGMKFFYLTRSLILSVAGTIVTYELVLLQVNHVRGETNASFCKPE